MTEILPPPPPGTTIAWVDEIDGAIISATIAPIENEPLYPLAPGATRHALAAARHMEVVSASRSLCVVDGEVVPRSTCPIIMSTTEINADGEDEVTIDNIPIGTRVLIKGAVSVPWTIITDGSVTITCSVPGTIRVLALCPAPYRDWTGLIHAV